MRGLPLGLFLATCLSLSCSDEPADALAPDVDAATASDASGDVPVDAPTPPDSLSPDLGSDGLGLEEDVEAPRGFGAPCGENADCESGYCIEGQGGFVCSQSCVVDCPAGWGCKAIADSFPDVLFICVPDARLLCVPCVEDIQCRGGRCAEIGGASFCATQCDASLPCPSGFSCILDAALGASLCRPTSGTCDCTPLSVGSVRSCQSKSEIGVCSGYETCDGTAFAGCTARTPAAEICDGDDNDCDGALDENAAEDSSCLNENTFGTCTGVNACYGAAGPVCNARQPEAEACNYQDDDCDSQTDEGFRDLDGVYAEDDHCGACGQSCDGAIPNAVAVCSVENGTPGCVVGACLAGYYPKTPLQCAPVPPKQCAPCTTDAECEVPGSRCVALGDGSACALPCGPGGSCQAVYSCTAVTGADVCVPLTGSCGCTAGAVGLQRGCSLTFESEGAPILTCSGTETCTATGWGSCAPPPDVCDGLDNDCDGTVDAAFVDPAGRYVADTDCGVCGNNCAVAPPSEATGFCNTADAVPSCSFICKSGHFDVDQNPGNGCECGYLGATDLPDGADQNCDGVDGEAENAVFVSKVGDDGAEGTRASPLRSIAAGLTRAAALGRRDVYVATGVYEEALVIDGAVSLYGGYSGDFGRRQADLYQTAVLAPAATAERPAAVNVSGVPATVTVAGLVIYGHGGVAPGAASIAVRIVDSGVTLSDCRIVAGPGASGGPGDPGAPGASGVAGAPGAAAGDIGQSTCTEADYRLGGGGGVRSCGASAVSGGSGGTAVCPDFDEDVASPACPGFPYLQIPLATEFGAQGEGTSGGAGGPAGRDATVHYLYASPTGFDCETVSASNCDSCTLLPASDKGGKPGGLGAAGVPGASGLGCSESLVVTGGLPVAPAGEAGSAGTEGSGGGGGGAAGGVETVQCAGEKGKFDDVGGSGGGGGSGGCGGAGGDGGGSGGASIGLLVVRTDPTALVPTLTGNTVVRGRGGDGGAGGPGGLGGVGGAGAAGGLSAAQVPASFCSAAGGSGGAGGAAGHGGGGGGGCGGGSLGVLVVGATPNPAWATANTIGDGDPGLGGPGGPSASAPGTAGTTGVGAAVIGL